MHRQPLLVLTDPAHFNVSYSINPWMKPGSWAADPEGNRRAARASFDALKSALEAAGARIEIIPGIPGLPDMVFPANAAIVLDGRALMARFRFPERQGEEPEFQTAFYGLMSQGLLNEVALLPPGCFQEGAGDCIWDATRGRFWAGFGQRSTREAVDAVAEFFGKPVTPLELVSERFYHLDVCFCPLSGGEILYYPPAFSAAGLAAIRELVPAEDLIEAEDEDAARFCVNAVNIGRRVVMAEPAPRLVARLAERGYEVLGVDLLPYIMSGGGAYCMTLRLDRKSVVSAAEPVEDDVRGAA